MYSSCRLWDLNSYHTTKTSHETGFTLSTGQRDEIGRVVKRGGGMTSGSSTSWLLESKEREGQGDKIIVSLGSQVGVLTKGKSDKEKERKSIKNSIST